MRSPARSHALFAIAGLAVLALPTLNRCTAAYQSVAWKGPQLSNGLDAGWSKPTPDPIPSQPVPGSPIPKQFESVPDSSSSSSTSSSGGSTGTGAPAGLLAARADLQADLIVYAQVSPECFELSRYLISLLDPPKRGVSFSS